MLRRAWNRTEFAASSAWQNFWRNAAVSIAGLLIVWVVLLALGILLLTLHSLDRIVAREQAQVGVISVFLADSTSLASAMDLKMRLERDPRVKSVVYVSKEQALKRFQNDPTFTPEMIESIGQNPLPASLDVTVRNLSDMAAVNASVSGSPLLDKNPGTSYKANIIDRIILLSRVAGIAGLLLVGGLTALSIFIIMLTIRTAIYLRRKEIEVMKLVGATDWFVRWPFLVEGMMTGTAGALLAVLMVGFGYRPAVINLQSVLFFVPLFYDPAYLRLVLVAILGFGMLLGGFGSYLGVRRFLHQ